MHHVHRLPWQRSTTDIKLNYVLYYVLHNLESPISIYNFVHMYSIASKVSHYVCVGLLAVTLAGKFCVVGTIRWGVTKLTACLRTCFERWSLRMKRRSHTGHTNFFSPVCVRRWRDNSSERANFFSHPSQVHVNGFSPARYNRMHEWHVSDMSDSLTIDMNEWL